MADATVSTNIQTHPDSGGFNRSREGLFLKSGALV